MSKRFKGKEITYSYGDVDGRVRISESKDGKLEKVVITIGKKNLVFNPADLGIAFNVARDLAAQIGAVCNQYALDDPIAELLRKEVLPMIVNRFEPRPGMGWKIPAIKKYRELTKCGLKEAKDAVEYIEYHGFEYFLNKVWAEYKVTHRWLFQPVSECTEVAGL